MALFDIRQSYELEKEEGAAPPPTFKDCVAQDVDDVFFNGDEHADLRTIDGKQALVILEEGALREHDSHWEAGAKQSLDTGLYKAKTILYIRKEDYGPKPKVGKLLVMDAGTNRKRTYSIARCEEECGVYRMTLERTRQ